VNHGGHDVPDSALVRCFPRSLQNLFEDYAKTTDRTRCFMNGCENPEVVFEQKGSNRVVFDQALYEQLILEAGW